jgi:hypothetical protein
MRATSAKAAVSPRRCRTGHPSPPPLTAASTAWSAGLNGSSAETAPAALETPEATDPEGEERDGQGEQHGEQRGRPDLARQSAERGAERREGDRARRERQHPERRADPVEPDEGRQSGQHGEPHDGGAARGQQDLLGEDRFT